MTEAPPGPAELERMGGRVMEDDRDRAREGAGATAVVGRVKLDAAPAPDAEPARAAPQALWMKVLVGIVAILVMIGSILIILQYAFRVFG